MLKVLSILGAFFGLCTTVKSQIRPTKVDSIALFVGQHIGAERVNITKDYDKDRYFSKEAFDRFFDKYFTQIKYERESFAEGNSAALKIADDKTRFNLTLSHKANNFIFSVGTGLNISDNSGVIFSGNKPTAGTELSTSFSYLIPKLRFLKFDGEDLERNYLKRYQVLDSLNDIYILKNPQQARVLNEKIRMLNDQIQRFQALIKNNTSTPERIHLYRDSMVQAIDKRLELRKIAEAMDDGLTDAADVANGLIKTAKERSVAKELETMGVTLFRMQWITGGLTYRRDKYDTYDSVLVFSDRVDDKNFDRWTLTAAWNFFWQRTDSWINYIDSKSVNSFYGNINYALVRTNSFEALKEQTLGINRYRSQNDTVYEFSTQKKLRDISGKGYETEWYHRVGIVTTAMLGKKQFFGINLSGQTEFGLDSTVFNTRVGLLFRFKDSDTEKSKVNFELFLALNDLSDAAESDKSAWRRKEIGISATVPFSKVFFR